MVLLIIIPFLNGYYWEYTLFSDKPMFLGGTNKPFPVMGGKNGIVLPTFICWDFY